MPHYGYPDVQSVDIPILIKNRYELSGVTEMDAVSVRYESHV